MLEQDFYEHLIKNNNIQQSKGKLQIYSDNIIQARMRALIDIFPAVTACLSKEYIEYVAQDYVKSHAPQQGNLNLYGNHFGAYLTNKVECKNYPFIRDLADFEYQIRLLLYYSDENHYHNDSWHSIIKSNKNVKILNASIGFTACYPVTDIADFCLEKTSVPPKIDVGLYHYFLYRDYVSQQIYVKPVSKHIIEIMPLLKTGGILSLFDLLNNQEIQDFLNFLCKKRLWVRC